MNAYSVATFIAAAIFIGLFIVGFFVDIPTAVDVILSVIAIIVMFIGWQHRNKNK